MKVIIADLDRELSNEKCMRANIKYMRRSIQRGTTFILTTAHSKENADSIIKEHGIQYTYLSAYNGIAIFNNSGEIERCIPIHEKVYREAKRYAQSFEGVHLSYLSTSELQSPENETIFGVLIKISKGCYTKKPKNVLMNLLRSNGLDSDYMLVPYNGGSKNEEEDTQFIICHRGLEMIDLAKEFAYKLTNYGEDSLIDTRGESHPSKSLKFKIGQYLSFGSNE